MNKEIILDLYENPITLKVAEASLVNFYKNLRDKDKFLSLMNFLDTVGFASKKQIGEYLKLEDLSFSNRLEHDIKEALRFNILNSFTYNKKQYYTINVNTKMFILKFVNSESIVFNGFHNIPLLKEEIEQQENVTNLYLSLLNKEKKEDFRLRYGYRIPVLKKQSSKPFIDGVPISHLMVYPKYVYDLNKKENLIQYVYNESGVLNKIETYAGLLAQENDYKLILLLQKKSYEMLEKIIKKIVQLDISLEKIAFLKWSDLDKYHYQEYSLNEILKEIKNKTFEI